MTAKNGANLVHGGWKVLTHQHSVESAIGILDSGVGGLTVVREVFQQLPKEKVLYFGDTLRCPYGPRPSDEVRRFTLEIVRYLSGHPLKALVIACNTATALALDEVRRQVNVPVLGVVEPGARAAIKVSQQGRVGVIGTEGTIRSSAYERALKRIDPRLYVVSLACPALVPLVESGREENENSRKILRESLAPLKKHRLDSLILGCTHYPLIASMISREMGSGVTLISSAEETTRELIGILSSHGLLRQGPARHPEEHHFFTSGRPEAFRSIAERWLHRRVRVEHAVLSALDESQVG